MRKRSFPGWLIVLFMASAMVLAACGGAPPEAPPAEEPTEAPAEEAPAEEAPAEEGDAEEAPAEEGDAEEAPAEEGDAEEAPAEEDSGDMGADPEPVEINDTVRQAFGGGPVGGAFQTFANAMALIMQDSYEYLDIAAEGTGGSGANLRGVNAGDFQYGLVYSGDTYLGLNGLLPEDETIYDQVRPVAALYGGVAHLVVSADSGIESVDDLPGKRIALGNAGSGAALAAERYFSTLGLLDEMQVEFLGYSQAASALGDGQLDGFWVLAAFPNSSVIEAATFTDIRLIDLYNPGVEGGFFDAFPFYTQRDLLGGEYTGVDEDVPSFQDTAQLVANADVPDDVVYNALVAIYSEEGLERMREAHPAASEMSRDGGVAGISTPIHPGAMRYWDAVGTDVSEDIQP
jgi:hypothetical protein